MNKDDFIKIVCKQIRFGWDHDVIHKELSNHLDDSISDLMEEGYLKDEAEKLAILQMGDPIEIGKQLDKEHKPLLGWLWLISKALVILLIIPSLFLARGILEDIYDYVGPISPAQKDEVIEINKTIDLEAHTVTIDNIEKINDNYFVTYHAKAKWNAIPVGVVDCLFDVVDEEGHSLYDYGQPRKIYNTFMGGHGSIWFELPKDQIIYLLFTDGSTIKIELKEYDYE